MAVKKANNMGGTTLPSCIRWYQKPVTPVKGHGPERGAAILSHLSNMAVNRTNMGDAAPPSCIRSYQTPVTIVRGQTERRWSNFKPSKMAVNRTNKQHGSCCTAVMYLVLPHTSYPSVSTRRGRRWSNFKSSKMAVKRTNKQHGSCCTAVMYPVVPHTSYPSERTWP